MKSQIQFFSNPQFGTIRTMQDDNGQPWFVGADLTKVLGYKNTSKAIGDHVDNEDKTTLTNRYSGSNYKTTAILINESGLYSLILSSKLPQARQFKHWVTSDVLPQIRRTGGYLPLKADMTDREVMEKALEIAHRTIEQKDRLLIRQQPLVDFAKAVTSCEDSILIRDLAKLLTQNGIKIGQARLFYWLRLHGYLFKRETRPIQKWVEQGLFDTTVYLFRGNGRTFESVTTKVTGKGQRYFLEGFLSGRFNANNGDFRHML